MPPKAVKRLTRKYAELLDEIAGIYLDEGEVQAAAVRRIRAELGLPSFKAQRFADWRNSREWTEALDAARERRQLASRTAGSVRGKRFLDWVRSTLEALRERYEKQKAIGKDAECARLEGRILRLADAARAEEKHLEEQRQKEAQRDMKKYATALVAAISRVDIGEEARMALADIARDPSKLLREAQ